MNKIDPFNVQAIIILIATSVFYGVWKNSVSASGFMFCLILMIATILETHRREMRS
jgi:hypothetical protein